MCCSPPLEGSRRILAQCIKRLGEWMHSPSPRGPDYSLLFIGSRRRFPLYRHPHGGLGEERGNHRQSLCVKGQEERYMRLWSRFEAKGYISSLTLSECSLFLLYRIAQVKLSHLNISNQHNTTQHNSSHQSKSSFRNTYLWAGLPSPRNSTRMPVAR